MLSRAMPTCGAERAHLVNALVDLQIALEDARGAEQLLAQLNDASAAAARLQVWLRQFKEHDAQAESNAAAFSAALRTIRTARQAHDQSALGSAKEALARFGSRGELLAELGLLELAVGKRAAQPYFDRAFLALQRETGSTPVAWLMPSALSSIRDATWSNDGGELWLWSDRVHDPALRPNERTGSLATVIDATSWEPRRRVPGPARSCARVVLDEGTRFATCEGLFDRDGERLTSFPRGDSALGDLLVRIPGEKRLLVTRPEATSSARLGLVDPLTGTFEALNIPRARPVAIDVAPDGSWFSLESSHGIEVFAWPTLKRLFSIPGYQARAVSATHLAAVQRDIVQVWRVQPAARVAEYALARPDIGLPRGAMPGFFPEPTSESLLLQYGYLETSWSWQQRPKPRDFHSEVDLLPNSTVLSVSVSPDGKSAAAIRTRDSNGARQLAVSDVNGAMLELEAAPELHSVAVAPNGKRVALYLAGHELRVFDLSQGSAQSFPQAMNRRLRFYDNDNVMLQGSSKAELLDVRDGSRRELLLRPFERFFERGSSGISVTLTDSPGGACATYGADDRLMRAFPWRPLTLSPSGEWLLLHDEDSLMLASTRTGLVARVRGSGTRSALTTFSANEARLATLSDAGLVVWDTQTSQTWAVAEVSAVSNATTLAFSADAEVVVVGRAHGDALAFRYRTGEQLAALPRVEAQALTWFSQNSFARAHRPSDGKWVASLVVGSQNPSGWLVDADGRVEVFGEQVEPVARCAFANTLVAWPVCAAHLETHGLFEQLARDAAQTSG
ncbi:MAG: hypothetical protein ACOY0T_32785 [Myxococcota bacterium]